MRNCLSLFFSLALLCSAHALSAQVTAGPLLGAAQHRLLAPDFYQAIDELPELRKITSLRAGAFVNVPVRGGFSVQPELHFTQKGFKLDESANLRLFDLPLPVGAVAVTRIDYVELPVLAKYNFGAGPVSAYLTAGPAVSYATGGKLDTRARLLVELDLFETRLDLDAIDYQRTELSGVLGGGVQFRAQNGNTFFVDARYTRGLTQVVDIPLVRDRLEQQSFGIQIGYGIAFGGGARRAYP